MRSSRGLAIVLAAIAIALLSASNLHAQFDTLITAGGVGYELDGRGGIFSVGGDWPALNAVGHLDSTGQFLSYFTYTHPAWAWEGIWAEAVVFDHAKSAIGVWSVSRYWQDANMQGHSQTGCAVWKCDSLGTFQWDFSTQFPDSASFIPSTASVDDSNTVTIFGTYLYESCCPCEPLHEAALGFLRITSDGAASFSYRCGEPRNVGWFNWPKDQMQPMTFSVDYDDQQADTCLAPGGDPVVYPYFYSHSLYRYASDSLQKLPVELVDIRTPVQVPPNSCKFDYVGYRPVESQEYGHIPLRLENDRIGNTFEILKEVQYSAVPDSYTHRYMLAKYDAGGSLAWMTPLSPYRSTQYSPPPTEVVADHAGGAVVGDMDGIRTFDSHGALVWYAPVPAEIHGSMNHVRLGVDSRSNVYARIWTLVPNEARHSWFACFSGESGKLRYVHEMGNDNVGLPVRIDSAGCIYGSFYVWGIAKLRQCFSIVLRDAEGDALPGAHFSLIRVADDPPHFTEDTLGTFVTDSQGVCKFPMVVPDRFLCMEGEADEDPDTLDVGDLIKVAGRVHVEPSVRHPGLVKTQYTIHLDNLHIDEYGAVAFDTVDGSHYKDIVLHHAEHRYNLLVSVEWDAVEAYQEGLREDFRQMSNYLYDVTDGQLRLDTVAVVDNGELWETADVCVRASNIHRPDAGTNAITMPNGYSINMPRKWFGDTDPCRRRSYDEHPLDAAESLDYRTKAHEFGHFALGFFDEYLFMDAGENPLPEAARCEPLPGGNYGYMDYQYEDVLGGVRASEMSSQYRYERESCKNTEQWVLSRGLSCWDYWESWAEREKWGIPIPICKPDKSDTLEHMTPGDLDYIPGPNDNLAVPDYDVGEKIYFASPIEPPEAGNRSLNLYVAGVPAGGVDVELWKSVTGGGFRTIQQGKTRDDGMLWVLGAADADNIQASGHGYIVINRMAAADEPPLVGRQWLTGSLELSTVTGENGAIVLQPIEGEYPLVLTADIAVTPQRWRLEFAQPFSQLPSLQFLSESGQPMTPAAAQLGDNYEVRPADSIAAEGSARLAAVDGAGYPFFVPFPYATYSIGDSMQLEKLPGPGAHAVLSLSSGNSAITKVLIAASPYPPIMNGLDPDAVQAGDAYSISVAPGVALSGVNSLTILYSESDLMVGDSLIGVESSLRMYRWNESVNVWENIGGTVDTVRNTVLAAIADVGVYAAFTPDLETGVGDDDGEDRGETPSYRFELSQNYPNPFNPATVIEYAVPSRALVTIEIFDVLGRKVRSLVNETTSAGAYRVEWDGADDAGRSVSSGVYLCRYRAGKVTQAKKMLLLR